MVSFCCSCRYLSSSKGSKYRVLSNEPREPAPNSSFPHHAAKSGVKHRQHSKSGSRCLFSFRWLGFALRLYSIWGSLRASRCHEALPGFPSKSGACLLGRGPSMAGPLLHPIPCCPVSSPLLGEYNLHPLPSLHTHTIVNQTVNHLWWGPRLNHSYTLKSV